jgi:replicative DNA helicase
MAAVMQINPHLETERVIIAILLSKPEKILSKHIESRWFKDYPVVIDAMLTLAGKGIAIDVISVSKQMGGKGLTQLADIQRSGLGASQNYPRYVEEVRHQFESRIIKFSIEKALADINSGAKNSEVINDLIADSMKATATEGKSNNYTSKEAMTVFIDKLTEIHDAKDSGGIGLKTGINDLDKVLGGLQPSDMTIVGARPGVGKTAFAISILHSLAKKGKRVGFFSTEMAVFQVMGRLASLEGNIPASKLRHADLDDLDFARLTKATSAITGMDFRICDKPAITVSELAMQARAWQADGGIDFIAVDYLTRLHADKPTQNQVQDIGGIVTALKNVARNLNIPVMVLAQLNRGSTARADKTPVMSDLRDSGVIEQEADQILLLYRPDEEDGAPEIIVDKNRHGECGVIRCVFEPTTMHWRSFE